MKKISTLCLLGILFAGCAFAAEEETQKPRLSISAENTMVFKRKYQPLYTQTSIDLNRMNESYAKIAYGLNDDFNLYAMLGAVDHLEYIAYGTQTNASKTLKFNTDPGFLWGIGVDGILYKTKNKYFLGTDARFSTWRADLSSVERNGETMTNLSGNIGYFEFIEKLYIGKEINTKRISYKPYVGFTYLYSHLDSYNGLTFSSNSNAHLLAIGEARNEDAAGVAVGAKVDIDESFFLNLEGRFINEQSFVLGGGFKFNDVPDKETSVKENLFIDASLENNITFNRNYQQFEFKEVNFVTPEAKIESTYETYAKISVGLKESFKLYTMLGNMNYMVLKEFWADPGSSNYIVKYRAKDGFLWGIGANGILYRSANNYFLGTDSHYKTWRTNLNKVTMNGDVVTALSGNFTYFEFLEKLYFGKQINTKKASFKPYIGLTYLYSRLDLYNPPSWQPTPNGLRMNFIEGLRNNRAMGVAIGTSVDIKKLLFVNLEGRFLNEQALTVSGGIKF